MDKLKKKVAQLLADEFPGAEIQISQYRPGKKLGGQIVWDGFVGKAQIDRQRRLRRAVDSSLAAEDALLVSLVLTLTPDEAAVMAGADDSE